MGGLAIVFCSFHDLALKQIVIIQSNQYLWSWLTEGNLRIIFYFKLDLEKEQGHYKADHGNQTMI